MSAKPKPKSNQLKIEQIPVEKLIPYAKNSRTHSDEQVLQIIASIREFGFTNPILIDSKNGIIAGHGRLLAAEKIGFKTVPCVRLGHLSARQKQAYIIADNRIPLNAGWDEELLKIEIKDLHEAAFDVGFLGFDPDELAQYLNGSDEEPTLPGPPEDPTFDVVVECSSLMEQKLVQELMKKKGIPTRTA